MRHPVTLIIGLAALAAGAGGLAAADGTTVLPSVRYALTAQDDFAPPMEYNPASFKWGISSAESDFMGAFLALFPKESAPSIDPKLCGAAREKSDGLARSADLPKKLDSSSFRPIL
jgi:hypothetical protein